eukprot:GHVH01016881.1.p1 GENE.GHVH01016881.1~~GHVH01016881.1.p1  ORF type:complete len:672 (-),score=114.31 GHVH01016881.1:1367-3382(-)
MRSGCITITVKQLVLDGCTDPLSLQLTAGDSMMSTPLMPPPYNINICMAFPDEGDKFAEFVIVKADGTELAEGMYDIDMVRNSADRADSKVLPCGNAKVSFDAMFVTTPEIHNDKVKITLYHDTMNDFNQIDGLKDVAKAEVNLIPIIGEEPSMTKTVEFKPDTSFRTVLEDLKYNNEQIVEVSMLDKNNKFLAKCAFNIWMTSQTAAMSGNIDSPRRGYHVASGDIVLTNEYGQCAGKLGLEVSLKEPDPVPTFGSIQGSKESVANSKSKSTSHDQPVIAVRSAQHTSSSSSTTSSSKNKNKNKKHKSKESSSSSYYGSSYEDDSVMPSEDRGAVFNNCAEFNGALDDELQRARAAFTKGNNCADLQGPPPPAVAEKLLAQVAQDIRKMEQIHWKSQKAVDSNRHLVYPHDLDELEDYCRQHAVQARAMRVDIEKKVMRAIAEITENEAKRAKRAAHTCRAITGHFEEKCEKVKCKETEELCQENRRITGKAIEHAKDCKLSVKRARQCNLDNVMERLEEAHKHRVLAESRIDELDTNMALFGDAMIKFNKKKEKKQRLKEEAQLRACLDYERQISEERHICHAEDSKRVDKTHHEVSYHALRTATYNHDYQAEEFHLQDSPPAQRRAFHHKLNSSLVESVFNPTLPAAVTEASTKHDKQHTNHQSLISC